MAGNPVYSSKRWRTLRASILSANPQCVICAKRGKLTPATVVDHIKPHKNNERLLWDRNNLQAVCKRCHDRKTATQDNDSGYGRWKRIPDFIDPPRIPVTIVCGPVGAGVREYAEANRPDDSILIDPDAIAANLSGEPVYRANMKHWLVPTMLERNRQLGELSRARAGECWFTVSGARVNDRRAWALLLNASKVIVLEVPAERCIENIRHSPIYDKPEAKRQVTTWWRQYTSDRSDAVVVRSHW